MKQGGEVIKMSPLGFSWQLLRASAGMLLMARLGRDPGAMFEATAERFGRKAHRLLGEGKGSEAGKAMTMRLMAKGMLAQRWALPNPGLAREIAAETLRESASFYGQGAAPSEFAGVMEAMASAVALGGSPAERGVFLKTVIKSREDAGFAFAVRAPLMAATEVEITARAAAGDKSWLEWLASGRDIHDERDRALLRAWGSALEARARGASMTEAIKKELTVAQDGARLLRMAKARFGRSIMNKDETGTGEAFVKALREALGL